MLVQPGDIIYIEPIRRPASEALRDYFPIVSILSSLITLIVVLNAQ
jgi:polysaccharide export outer membrane protein